MILTAAGLTDQLRAAQKPAEQQQQPSPGFRVSEVFLTH